MKLVFIGTTNAMPMMYALKFKEHGYDVKYIVDVDKGNTLSRPECHYNEISYPYPDWVREIRIKRPSIKVMFPSFFLKAVLSEIDGADVYFLCDWYIALAPYLPPKAKIVILPHGADLDTWCNIRKANDIAKVGKFSFLWPIKKILAKKIISNMRDGMSRANAITYYPRGLNSAGDEVVEEFSQKNCVEVIRRYDVNFTSARLFEGGFKERNGKLKICIAVRFDYLQKNGIKNEYLKGSDLIIKALGKYYREYSKNISVVCFNKGHDVDSAKLLCINEGIESVVHWEETVPFQELLSQFELSDVCFDQVGGHWMGAVGIYSMYLGKPVIVNYRPEVFDDFLVGDNPLCQAKSIDDIFNQLVRLSNDDYRRDRSVKSREFAIRNFDCNVVFAKYESLINSWRV